MKFPFFCYYKDEEYFWFRICGYGLGFTCGYMTFSERNGYVKKWKFGKWRMKFLHKSDGYKK